MNANLTANEQRAMDAVIKSAKGNGYDFGFTEDVVKAMRDLSPKAVGGLLTSLQNKGQIDIHEPVTTNHGTRDEYTYVQITLNEALYESLTATR